MADSLILSGKIVSQHVYSALIDRINQLRAKQCIPNLAVILVGDNPASQVYVKNKTSQFEKLGLNSKTIHMDSAITEIDLIHRIQMLNRDEKVHGILVQMPLTKHLNESAVVQSIEPQKDVDGFHPENIGLLSIGKPRFIPCTPKGVLRILKYYNIDPSGKHIVILGRSNIVGRPLSILLSLKQSFSNATTTLCHSGTKDISFFTQQADILIAAMGIPGFIKSQHLKDGAVVIDVGINRVRDTNNKQHSIKGDVDYENVLQKVSAITPVPGGVGPMTIAMLVENTIEAAESYQS